MPSSEVLSRALETLGGSAFVEALAERQELLRFGGSRVTYQHSEERLLLRAKLVRAGRAAWGTAGSLEPSALRGLRSRLEEALEQFPPNGEAWLPESSSDPRPSATFFESAAALDAPARAQMFRSIRHGLPDDVEVGGSIATSVVDHALAASTGLYREEQRTRASVQIVASRGPHSAFARALHRNAAVLDLDSTVARAAERLEPLPAHSLEPGTYRAVLQAPAVIILLASLGQWAFNGRSFLDGESAFAGRLGEPVLSPALTLWDDGADARGLPTSFDCEGTAKSRVLLLADGVLRGQVMDTVTARRAGQASTGHGVPPGWRFGSDPCPSHMVLEPGTLVEEELIDACGTGLLIQRVDYVRVVHPRETLVTGTTRDATCWIENGRVVARLPQFRFTLRLVDLFNTVEALGSALERGEMVFMESIAAPAALVGAFPVGTVVG
jgi:predicted Zn-dependent protease